MSRKMTGAKTRENVLVQMRNGGDNDKHQCTQKLIKDVTFGTRGVTSKFNEIPPAPGLSIEIYQNNRITDYWISNQTDHRS